MVLSRLLLQAQYNTKHLAGVGLCLVGLALTIVSDLQGDEADSGHPHAVKGDVLCILGATLYAGSNVMQEDFVKNYNRVSCCRYCFRNNHMSKATSLGVMRTATLAECA